MILKAFSIRDQKAEVFNTPFFQKTHGEAERSFRAAVMDEKTQLNKYPEDFNLYYVGQYDDNTGVFEAKDAPEHVLGAIQCHASNKPKIVNDEG